MRVRLEKVGHYVVGERFEPPGDEHVRKCVELVKLSSLMFVAGCTSLLLFVTLL